MSFKSNLVIALFVFYFILFYFLHVAACDCLKKLAREIRSNQS